MLKIAHQMSERSNDLVFTPIEDAIRKHNEINQDLLQIAEILAM
jgi:6-phosphofructokinase 1